MKGLEVTKDMLETWLTGSNVADSDRCLMRREATWRLPLTGEMCRRFVGLFLDQIRHGRHGEVQGLV